MCPGSASVLWHKNSRDSRDWMWLALGFRHLVFQGAQMKPTYPHLLSLTSSEASERNREFCAGMSFYDQNPDWLTIQLNRCCTPDQVLSDSDTATVYQVLFCSRKHGNANWQGNSNSSLALITMSLLGNKTLHRINWQSEMGVVVVVGGLGVGVYRCRQKSLLKWKTAVKGLVVSIQWNFDIFILCRRVAEKTSTMKLLIGEWIMSHSQN